MENDRSQPLQHEMNHDGNQVHWAEKIWKELNSISQAQNSIETMLSSIGIYQFEHDADTHGSLVNSFDGDEKSTTKSTKQKESTISKKIVNPRNRKQRSSQNKNATTYQRNCASYDEIMNLIHTNVELDDNIETLSSKLFSDVTENSIFKEDHIQEQSRQNLVQNQVPLETVASKLNINDPIIQRDKIKHEKEHTQKVRITSNSGLKYRQQHNKDTFGKKYREDVSPVRESHENKYEDSAKEEGSDENEESATYTVLSVSSVEKQGWKSTSDEMYCNEIKSHKTLSPSLESNVNKNMLSKREYVKGANHSTDCDNPSLNCQSVFSKDIKTITDTNDSNTFSCYSKDDTNCGNNRSVKTPSSYESLRVMRQATNAGLTDMLKKEIIESKSALTEANTLLLNKC